MKALLCVFLYATVIVNAASLYDKYKQDWINYKNKFQKKYKTEDEDNIRFKIFLENKLFIDEHNERHKTGEETYTVGINQYSDMLPQEISQKMNGFRPRPNQQRRTSNGGIKKTADLPESVDWVKKGAVTPVKDQGQCGSCWAFSATGALEGRNFIKKGYLVSLSEQNLMDCSAEEGNNGCNGGTMDDAFEYVIENNGLDTEKSYPYEGVDSSCRFNASAVGGTATNFEDVPSGDEEALKAAVAQGPVSVTIDASIRSFQHYMGGIYQDASCESDADSLDHGVLVVGYGKDERYGLPYWLIKNSWSTSWGDNGYIKILRNNENICGVATAASYPVV